MKNDNEADWSGKERRKLSNDWIERDRLLSEVHTDMKHLVEWAKSHDKSDNEKFKVIGDRVSWIEKVAYTGIGGIVVLNVVLKLIH